MSGAPRTASVPDGPARSHEPDDPDAQRRAERSAAVLLERDPATRELGITLERVAPGFARLRMAVTDTMVNGHGTCHGGYLFTFADSAFAFACNTFNRVTVAAGASIDFLAPARSGDVLHAEGRVLSQGRRTGVYDVVIEDEGGRALALFRGRSHRLDGTLYDEAPDDGVPDDGVHGRA